MGKRIVILGLLVAIMSVSALGAEAEKEGSADFLSNVKITGFEIGPEIYSYKYEEPGLMEETGVFYGIFMSGTSRPWVETESDKKWMTKLEGEFAWGQVDYDGGTQNPETGEVTPYTFDGIDDYMFEARLLFGPDYLKENSLTTVYAGLGYRLLFDEASAMPGGYDRTNNRLYLPVGITGLYGLKNGWSCGLGGEFDLLLWGEQTSDFTPYGYEEVKNKQNTGYGLRASIKFQKHGEKTDFIIEPFFRYWDIDDSEWNSGLIEPANETTEFGVRLTWLF